MVLAIEMRAIVVFYYSIRKAYVQQWTEIGLIIKSEHHRLTNWPSLTGPPTCVQVTLKRALFILQTDILYYS